MYIHSICESSGRLWVTKGEKIIKVFYSIVVGHVVIGSSKGHTYYGMGKVEIRSNRVKLKTI